jgi:hypothetical protein
MQGEQKMQNNYVKELAVKTFQEPRYKDVYRKPSTTKSPTLIVCVLAVILFTGVLI